MSKFLFTPGGGETDKFGDVTSSAAFDNRISDAILRVKQDLGIDELLIAIDDSRKIASAKVAKYLENYSNGVVKAVGEADTKAKASYTALKTGFGNGVTAPDVLAERRSGKSVERLVAMTWKHTYEIQMEDVNARMPLAQQIVSKYMSNFSVKPKMG